MSAKRVTISDAAMLRSMVYDIGVPDPEEFMASLGFPKVSEEGQAVELEARKTRLSRLEGGLPLYISMATVASQIMLMVHGDLAESRGKPLTDEQAISLAIAYQQVAGAAILSTLSYLMDVGVLKYSTDDDPDEEADDDERLP